MDSYCKKCSLQFGNMTVYNMHLSIVHKENVEIKQEPNFDTFEKEIEEPEKVPFQCQISEKAFSEKRKLERHISRIHEESKAFHCDICNFKCSQKWNLKTHIASVHEKKKPFKCDICDYSCSEKSSLKKHVSSVHEEIKPFKCDICDYSYSSFKDDFDFFT